jgi:RHS repeat-associated protein
MRNADGSDDATCAKPDLSPSTRGFTGQEQVPGICAINFNARIYDPTLGKFLTPDSVTQSIFAMQVLNRYSYVGNNPLSLTDPTGHVFDLGEIALRFSGQFPSRVGSDRLWPGPGRGR